MEFDWDAGNLKHIARHGVTALEADVQPHAGEERILCFGRAKSGRLLTILYTERRGKIRVVTAYEMTKQQQRMYLEGK